ncbi:hypothetical protein MCAP1_003047 [Malassezia caprae]|uniref:Uncharacterized protein n=1 Tax=Malassezia caprae TaxID=1381934 RepID=A0AAF0EAN7_9BASI|nr:hypothetical protein MCAP1_003047 [Malassezia caprae]
MSDSEDNSGNRTGDNVRAGIWIAIVCVIVLICLGIAFAQYRRTMYLRRHARNTVPVPPAPMPLGAQAPYTYPPNTAQATAWDESLGPDGEPLPRYEPPATPPPAFDAKMADSSDVLHYSHTPEPRAQSGPSAL